MAEMGRPTAYRPKSKKRRYQGSTTEAGGKLFEAARKELQRLTKIKNVSDGDVMDYLARAKQWP